MAPFPEPALVDPDMTFTPICWNIAATPKHGSEAATTEQTLQGRWVELITRADDAAKPGLMVAQVRCIRFEGETHMAAVSVQGLPGARLGSGWYGSGN